MARKMKKQNSKDKEDEKLAMEVKGLKKKVKKKGGNAWMRHLKAFWSKNKGKMSYREAMVKAKATYKKK